MEALACSLQEEDARELALMNRLQMENRLRDEVQTGVDKILFSMLPVTEWAGAGKEGCDECPLCLCEYEVGERVMRLPCLHGAHEDCLTQCLSKSTQCPICKLDVQESLKAMCED